MAWRCEREALGFGFVELGTTITAKPHGQSRPRLFRFPAEAIHQQNGLQQRRGQRAWRRRCHALRQLASGQGFPVGINIGKSKTTPAGPGQGRLSAQLPRLAWIRRLFPVINVSSPNTPGLRDLQEISRLREIVRAIAQEAGEKPLLVKIAPDLRISRPSRSPHHARRKGLQASSRQTRLWTIQPCHKEIDEQGGLSGRPLAGRSTKLCYKNAPISILSPNHRFWRRNGRRFSEGEV